MAGTRLTPEKITSPFQLMAAWFSMLVLIASVLLTAAANISEPAWAAGYLVGFTSVVVILVLACVTLMLTVFRPHLQEGKEYARWLKDKHAYSAGVLIREQTTPSPRRGAISHSRDSEEAESRSSFLVSVTDAPSSQMVVKALRSNGFTAEIYKESGVFNVLAEHEAIWVGHRVPFKDAIEAITISAKLWPHLKYLELSNDGGTAPPDEIHDQMYIGGATSAATLSGLTAWTADELASLSKARSSSEFHAAIRRKYS